MTVQAQAQPQPQTYERGRKPGVPFVEHDGSSSRAISSAEGARQSASCDRRARRRLADRQPQVLSALGVVSRQERLCAVRRRLPLVEAWRKDLSGCGSTTSNPPSSSFVPMPRNLASILIASPRRAIPRAHSYRALRSPATSRRFRASIAAIRTPPRRRTSRPWSAFTGSTHMAGAMAARPDRPSARPDHRVVPRRLADAQRRTIFF